MGLDRLGGWIDRMMREDPDKKKKESDRSKSGKKMGHRKASW